MDAATARARLQRMVQDTTAPTLTSAEVDDLLLLARRPDDAGNNPENAWLAGTIYQVGARVVPAVFNGHVYTATVAGTSGNVQPTFPTAQSTTVADGGVTWQEAGPYLWNGAYSLRWAAAEGWRWKAAKVTPNYDVAPSLGASFKRSQVYEECMAMADRYARSLAGSIQMEH